MTDFHSSCVTSDFPSQYPRLMSTLTGVVFVDVSCSVDSLFGSTTSSSAAALGSVPSFVSVVTTSTLSIVTNPGGHQTSFIFKTLSSRTWPACLPTIASAAGAGFLSDSSDLDCAWNTMATAIAQIERQTDLAIRRTCSTFMGVAHSSRLIPASSIISRFCRSVQEFFSPDKHESSLDRSRVHPLIGGKS